MISILNDPEVIALIADLDLVLADSPEAVAFDSRNRIHECDFSDEFSVSPVYDNLCELLYMRNRRWSRFVPEQFVFEPTLF